MENKTSLDEVLKSQKTLYFIEAVASDSDKVKITAIGSNQSLILHKRVIKSVNDSGESVISGGRKLRLVSILFENELLTEVFDQLSNTDHQSTSDSIALAFPPSPLQSSFDRNMAYFFAKLAYTFGEARWGSFYTPEPQR